MNNKLHFLSGMLGGMMAVAVVGLFGFAWTQAGYEGAAGTSGLITDATVADQIDDYIRDGRQEIRYRAEVEHFWGDNDTLTDDNGLHRLGSARCYMSNSAPTELSNSHTGIGAATIADYDNATGSSFSGEPNLNNSATNSAAGIEDDVGHGRCWIDLDGPDGSAGTADDNKLYIFIGVAGAGNGAWTAVDAAARPDGDDEILAGSYNLVYNGSFEATDGDGDPASTTVPEGWTAVDGGGGGAPTIGYVNPTLDTDYGDGYHLTVTDAGGGGTDYIQQTLTFREANTFKVLARVDSDGVDTCRLTTNGASTTESGDIDTTSTNWTTLSGTFVTASLDTVEIRLVSVTAGSVCAWDHVAVYRIGDVEVDRPEISQPGIIAMQDSDNTVGNQTGNTFGTVPNLQLIFTPPSSGWVVQVGFAIAAETTSVNEHELNCRLNDNVTGVLTATEVGVTVDADASNDSGVTLTNVYINPVPVAGTTYTYTVECSDEAAGPVWEYNLNSHDGNDRYSNLWLIAYPAR